MKSITLIQMLFLCCLGLVFTADSAIAQSGSGSETAKSAGDAEAMKWSKGGTIGPAKDCGEIYLGDSAGTPLSLAPTDVHDVWFHPYVMAWKDGARELVAGANSLSDTWWPRAWKPTPEGLLLTVESGRRPIGIVRSVRITQSSWLGPMMRAG